MSEELSSILIMTEWTAGHIYKELSKVWRDRKQLFNTVFSFLLPLIITFTIKKFHHSSKKRCRITLYMRKISFIWSRLMVPLPNLSYSYKKKTPHFYRTQVRSLLCLPLVTKLTHRLLFSIFDWYDSGWKTSTRRLKTLYLLFKTLHLWQKHSFFSTLFYGISDNGWRKWNCVSLRLENVKQLVEACLL